MGNIKMQKGIMRFKWESQGKKGRAEDSGKDKSHYKCLKIIEIYFICFQSICIHTHIFIQRNLIGVMPQNG